MGKIIIYIMAVVFALAVAAILGLVIVADALKTREYLRAGRVMAKIDHCAGEKKTSNYGLLQPASRYYCYDVSFVINGNMYSGRHLSKEIGLRTGDPVEIRYINLSDQGIKIVNRDIKDRFLRMVICAVIAIPLSVLCIIFYK